MRNKKYKPGKSPATRHRLRLRYMDLMLYPDEYKGTVDEYHKELEFLRSQIRNFKYKSIRSFINETLEDSMNGLESDVAEAVVQFVRGYRDNIFWECTIKAHRLTVNEQSSDWRDTKSFVEVGGYMAIYIRKNKCRILRIFDVEKYTLIREDS